MVQQTGDHETYALMTDVAKNLAGGSKSTRQHPQRSKSSNEARSKTGQHHGNRSVAKTAAEISTYVLQNPTVGSGFAPAKARAVLVQR